MDSTIPTTNENQLYAEILHSLDYCIIYTDAAGTIKSFNTGAEQMLGYSSSEIIDKHNALIFHQEEEIAKKSDLLSKELGYKIDTDFRVLTAKSQPGKPDNNIWTFTSKDGNKISVRLSVFTLTSENPETSGYLLIANDVTKTNKAQKQVLVYEDIVKHTSSGLYVFRLNESEEDFDFDLITANSAAATLTGYDAEKMIGKKISEILPPFMNSKLPKLFKKVALGLQKGFQEELEYGDENIRKGYYSVDVFALPNKGIGVSFENITERKLMETELINAKELAEKSLRAKDIFLANMSHEIRTPLNAIIGFTDILINTHLNKDQQESILAVKSAGENLLAVINDILDFSKIESGKLQIENVPFHLTDTLKKINELLKIKAGEKKIELNFNLDISLPAYVSGDKVRLNQVLMNLIGNAIKFTEKGFVDISVKVTEEKNDKSSILFSVKDSGIGIPTDKLEIIFDRFVQASGETTRKYGGTGLGLSISKNLVELCGGKLNVKSEVGKGSEFSFSLTFDKVEESVIKDIAGKLTEWKPQGVVKILLAEDNVLNQRLAKKVVEGFGFKLDIAEDGKQAIQKLKENTYSLVLMDLQMPEMDGYQTASIIRKQLQMNIPIMAMTAHSLVGEKEKCIEAGMNDYISKPFKADDLYNKITMLLGNHQFNLTNTQDMQNENTHISTDADLTYLRELSGGNKDFEKEMIELFLNNVPLDISRLEIAIKNSDASTISAITHKLKSSFAIVGLNDVTNHLNELKSLSEIENTKDKSLLIWETIDKRFWRAYPGLFSIIKDEY